MDASYIPIAKARGFTTHWINHIHTPTTISNIPDILPANFDFLYPRKFIVSGVVNGNKTTSIPITIIPIPIMKTLLLEIMP